MFKPHVRDVTTCFGLGVCWLNSHSRFALCFAFTRRTGEFIGIGVTCNTAVTHNSEITVTFMFVLLGFD